MQTLSLEIFIVFTLAFSYTTAFALPQIIPITNLPSLNTTTDRTGNRTATNTLFDDCAAAIDLFPTDPPSQILPARFSRNPDRGVYTLPQERVHGICSAEAVFSHDVSTETGSWQGIRELMHQMNERLRQVGGVVITESTGAHRGIELWLLDYTSSELAGLTEGTDGLLAPLLDGEPPVEDEDAVAQT